MSSFLTAHLGKRRHLLTDPLDMSPLECVNLAVPCIGEGSAAGSPRCPADRRGITIMSCGPRSPKHDPARARRLCAQSREPSIGPRLEALWMGACGLQRPPPSGSPGGPGGVSQAFPPFPPSWTSTRSVRGKRRRPPARGGRFRQGPCLLREGPCEDPFPLQPSLPCQRTANKPLRMAWKRRTSISPMGFASLDGATAGAPKSVLAFPFNRSETISEERFVGARNPIRAERRTRA